MPIVKLFEYYADQMKQGKDPRTATIKGRINAITRLDPCMLSFKKLHNGIDIDLYLDSG